MMFRYRRCIIWFIAAALGNSSFRIAGIPGLHHPHRQSFQAPGLTSDVLRSGVYFGPMCSAGKFRNIPFPDCQIDREGLIDQSMERGLTLSRL